MKHLCLAGFTLGCLLAFGTSSARADLITFDDIPNPGSGPPPITAPVIANGYHGFNWSNFYVLNPNGLPGSGYTNGVVSPTNIAYNGYGAQAILSSSTPFSLDSGYFTAAWNDGLSVTVTGKLNGSVVGTDTFVVGTSAPSFEQIGFANVDTVIFSSQGGTPVHNGGTGEQFALDNLSVNGGLTIQSVSNAPEPTSLALFGIGSAAASLYGWRRRRVVK